MLEEIKRDERGELMEFVNRPGQVFVIRIRPHAVRGNHFHYHKIERFLVVSGQAVIRLRYIDDDFRVTSYPVDGADWKVIAIPPRYAHSIENVGETDVTLVVWANEIFDPEKPDTYEESV